MIQVENLLQALAKRRPVFHSEADFQHELAWEIHQSVPQSQLRLEYPVHVSNWFTRPETKFALDILATISHEKVAIECKYKVAKLKAVVSQENFALASQQAHNEGTYDFVLDVMRLEKMIEQKQVNRGLACLLTNEAKYWQPSMRVSTNMDAFRLLDKRLLTGVLAWDASKRQNRTEPLELKNNYHLDWQNYSKVEGTGAGQFRCLLVEVQPL